MVCYFKRICGINQAEDRVTWPDLLHRHTIALASFREWSVVSARLRIRAQPRNPCRARNSASAWTCSPQVYSITSLPTFMSRGMIKRDVIVVIAEEDLGVADEASDLTRGGVVCGNPSKALRARMKQVPVNPVPELLARVSQSQSLWAHNPNLVKIPVVLTCKVIIRSGPNFAQVMTAQLSWLVQICDLIGPLE